MFQNITKIVISKLFFNDSKQQKTKALSCSKRLSALLKGITSKTYCEFYYLNCLHSFRTKSKLESHKRVCENEDFCNMMRSKDTKILEVNQKILLFLQILNI